MEKLSEIIKKNGFQYHLVERTKDKAIYSQLTGNKIESYEVFKIKVQEESKVIIACIERHFKHKEVFPGNEDFGKTAWCYRSKKFAMEHYKVLE